MSKEGYIPEKKEADNKIVLERLQIYLKDKRSNESSEASVSCKAGPSYEIQQPSIPVYEDGSTVLKEILNHKKAELLRNPDVIEFLKTVATNLKKWSPILRSGPVLKQFQNNGYHCAEIGGISHAEINR